MLDGLVEQLGIVAQRSDQSLTRGGCCRLTLPLEGSPSFGKGVIDGGKMPLMYFREYVAIDIIR
jgi:hypothetical protein